MTKRKKLILSLMLVFAINIFIISLAQMSEKAKAQTYSWGSSGSTVREIQTRLSNWGYYYGSIDGIYGNQTYNAVRYFQSANGLTVDGVVGPKTLAALGLPSGGTTANTYTNDINLLARLISAESRGEPYTGQVAVGAVVLNRMEHPSFPHTLSGVIYQNGAFTCLDDGEFYQPVVQSAYKAARDAINGWDPTGGAIYYFNPDTATSAWIWSRPLLIEIGKHRFCE